MYRIAFPNNISQQGNQGDWAECINGRWTRDEILKKIDKGVEMNGEKLDELLTEKGDTIQYQNMNMEF